jgi:hypothetical protein
MFARQPYNGNNTPNLVYSDYESRSTTDSAEDGEATCSSRNDDATSPSAVSEHQYHPYSHNQQSFGQQQQEQQYYQNQPQQRQTTASSSGYSNYNNNNGNNTNMIYPPYEFEELPQDGRRDWWPYRSTTTA